MSRSRLSRTGAAVVAVTAAALAVIPAAAGAQTETESPDAAVAPTELDIVLTVESLDGSLATAESDEEVKVTLGADVLFAFDSASLKPAAAVRISEAAALVGERGAGRVLVDGYTDSRGDAGYNLRLSRSRAEAVARALSGELGSGAPELVTGGRGEEDPVAPNTTPEGADNPKGRARNRRVTLTFEPG